jgi:hypothetical protein
MDLNLMVPNMGDGAPSHLARQLHLRLIQQDLGTKEEICAKLTDRLCDNVHQRAQVYEALMGSLSFQSALAWYLNGFASNTELVALLGGPIQTQQQLFQLLEFGPLHSAHEPN